MPVEPGADAASIDPGGRYSGPETGLETAPGKLQGRFIREGQELIWMRATSLPLTGVKGSFTFSGPKIPFVRV
jgi:hypothetical protein